MAANWDTCVRCNCLKHGLTVHTTYEVISPYPKFRAPVCLNYANHIVLNTGNFLHVLRVDLDNISTKNLRTVDKQDSALVDIEHLDEISINETEETKTDHYDSLEDKGLTPESSVVSPKCDSTITEFDFNDETQSKNYDRAESEQLNNISSSNQSDFICDSYKSNLILSDKAACGCSESAQCQCHNSSGQNFSQTEQQVISVRDKILQDFCEDVSQELSIGSDLVTLVKHPPCSPRSTPQRLPPDLKSISWPSPTLTPPSDILKTRNSESSHRNSPQPSVSQSNSISSPLHTFSIETKSPSPRLMSPPIARSLR